MALFTRVKTVVLIALVITKMNVHPDVNFEELARSTDDFNGAQLKAVCVEAGMLALRRDATEVNHEDFNEGIIQVQAKKKASSYEKFIWGFKLKPLKHEPSSQNLTLTPLFSYQSHLAHITAAAASGPAAASGSADDTIHLYDLPSASSLGSLHQHTSSVTAVTFFTPPSLSFPRNLLSALLMLPFCSLKDCVGPQKGRQRPLGAPVWEVGAYCWKR
uniref:AAA ATPase AAA+ lid domain-containing protein n=1 Tax=Salix viminalis TaxID=40686 RepID=A0A6N2LUC0_SALVM